MAGAPPAHSFGPLKRMIPAQPSAKGYEHDEKPTGQTFRNRTLRLSGTDNCGFSLASRKGPS